MSTERLPNWTAITKQSCYILLMTLLSGSYIVCDQMFTAKLSHQYLAAEVIVSYFSMAFLLIARLIGQAYLVKGQEKGFGHLCWDTYMALGVSIAAALIFFSSNLMEALSIPFLPGMHIFTKIYVGVTFLSGLNLLLKFMLVGQKKAQFGIYADTAGNVLNVLGNALFFAYGPTTEATFVGFGISSLAAQALVFLTLVAVVKPIDPVIAGFTSNVVTFFRKTKNIIYGDLLTNILRVVAPFLVTLYIRDTLGDMYAVAYNIGNYLLFIVERPYISTTMASMPMLAKLQKLAWIVDNEVKKASIIWLPITCVIVNFLPYLLERFYSISTLTLVALIQMMLIPTLSLWPTVLPICKLRLREKQSTIAMIELLCGDLAVLCLLMVMPKSNYDLLFAVCFVIPGVVRNLAFCTASERLVW